MYQALYRKWRPRDFDSVVGQEHITTTLKNEIADQKFAHAYLFTGSRGTGKTTCAKIVAKAVNCEETQDGNPCGKCPACTGIDDGSILDVVEIDAASNNGVDNIRQLREEAHFLPVAVKYRVYILDECHMLSTGAVNALLKILEEPPAHVLFVLATTEVHKVLPTILSRCQRFDFKRIKSSVIAAHLMQICAAEQVEIDEDAALLIARISDGGMRDALSLLELCVSYRGRITVQTVTQASGLGGQDELFALVDGLIEEEPAKALSAIEALSENSVDFARLCEQLINHLRNLMILRTVKEPDELITGTKEHYDRLHEQAQRMNLARILAALDVLQDTAGRMSRTAFKRTELEMAAIRICHPAQSAVGYDPSELIERIAALERGIPAAPVTAAEAAPVHTAKPEQVNKTAEPPPKQATAAPPQEQPPAPTEREAPPSPEPPPQESGDTVRAFSKWPQVMALLQKSNPALYGAMIDSRAFTSGEMMLVDCQNDLFLSLLRTSPAAKESLRDAILKVTGQKYNLGPYKAEQHVVSGGGDDPLKDMLKKAAELNVPVELK